jgi:hypothetical protein
MNTRRHETGLRSLAALATLLFVLPTPARATTAEKDLVTTLVSPAGDEVDLERKLREVVGLGVGVAPQAIDLLAGRTWDERFGSRERELLLEATRRWPEEACIDAVLGLLGDEPAVSDGTTAARLLGEFAGGRGIQPLFAIARSFEPTQMGHPQIAGEIERALSNMLRRDTLGFGYLREELSRTDGPLLACVVHALGTLPSDEGATMLIGLLGREHDLDGGIIESLGLQGPLIERCCEGACAESVRRYLNDVDPKLRKHAVIALGRLGDTTSLQSLVEGLDDHDRRVRGASLWSLRRITGLGWSADMSRWQQHLEAEEVWLGTTFADLRDDALGEDVGRARKALHTIAAHKMVRHETASRLAIVFEHEPEIASAACEALARLGGPEAVLVLRAAAQDPRDEVAEAAERALATIHTRVSGLASS